MKNIEICKIKWVCNTLPEFRSRDRKLFERQFKLFKQKYKEYMKMLKNKEIEDLYYEENEETGELIGTFYTTKFLEKKELKTLKSISLF